MKALENESDYNTWHEQSISIFRQLLSFVIDADALQDEILSDEKSATKFGVRLVENEWETPILVAASCFSRSKQNLKTLQWQLLLALLR